MKLLVKKGKTSKRVFLFVQDSSSTVGAGLTGLTSASSGLVCYRAREDDGNAGATQLTLSAGTKGTWSSGGFVEKDATNQPGVYELGLDNAGLATGSDTVVYYLKGATNMAPCVLEVQLVDFDPQDAVRLGLTALPNANAAASGGLPTFGSGTGQINPSGGKVPATLASTDVTGNVAADLQTIKTQTVTCAAGVTVLASVGTASTSTAQTGDCFTRIGANGAGLTAVQLAAAGLDAVVVETGLNARQALSIIASSTAGVLAGAAGTSVTIAAAGVPATNRITATVDASGNRSAVTLSPPA